ncbi:PREDICTED: putative nuclease HARBI1 [Cyphomyrmex costatus]|uniref:putative nuclease HARBI1 n=1 Tax=Cyphomyrmex costatus TaxID=456900 RepID=UPI0008523547|nr:PREDICTED: putative nuclease HARBI1 [Cyphomyrmex costatus]
MDIDINVYSSDEDFEPRRRLFRPRMNYFEEYDQEEFHYRFRLKPRTVENILEEIRDIISHPTGRNNCLTASQQLLLALNFYANGSFLRIAGDCGGVSVPTASRTVARVSQAIASLCPRYIKMPEGDEATEVRQAFYNIARFPRYIGSIDCTHIKIQSPGGDNAEIFRNRKQFFSLNVQTVADPFLKIRDIVARWPGSCHDSHIFRNSALYTSLETGRFGDNVLVGDSGYPVKPYLMTPLQQVRNNAEALYNESIVRTRNVVERKYGVWKRRFPALAMGIRLKLDTVQAMVVATAVLHNKACDEKERLPPINREQEIAIDNINNVPVQNIEGDIIGIIFV